MRHKALRRIQLRTQTRNRWRLGQQTTGVSSSRPWVLSAPSDFSLVSNPSATAAFVARVRAALAVKDVTVRLDAVTDLSPDALLALVTVAECVEQRKGHLTVSLPREPRLREKISQWGFPQLARSVGLRADGQRAVFHTQVAARAEAGLQVDPARTDALVEEVCRNAGIPYHKISYANLIECMTNTNNHAGEAEGSIRWRLMVTWDTDAKRLQFFFLDPGRGICNTLKFRFRRLTSDGKLLALLLNAKSTWLAKALAGLPAKTRTGVRGRGRGLRKIAESIKRGGLSRLVLVANRGYFDATQGHSLELTGDGFNGTLIHWEIAVAGD